MQTSYNTKKPKYQLQNTTDIDKTYLLKRNPGLGNFYGMWPGNR